MGQVVAFREFSDEEINAGLAHAAEKDGVTLYYSDLKRVANDAGLLRIKRKWTPRKAVTEALWAYEKRNGKLTERKSEAFVHAFAKMLNLRSPRVAAKRAHEKQIAELGSLSELINPAIQRELDEMTQSRRADA